MEITFYYYNMTKANMLHLKYFLLLKKTFTLGPDLDLVRGGGVAIGKKQLMGNNFSLCNVESPAEIVILVIMDQHLYDYILLKEKNLNIRIRLRLKNLLNIYDIY